MTTRRNMLNLAAGAALAALGPGQVSASEIHADPSQSDLDVLIACRDEIRRIERQTNDPDPLSLMLAAHNLDSAIMKMCPHDPATYTIRPGSETPGTRTSDWVTCPSCHATISSALLACFHAQEGRSA